MITPERMRELIRNKTPVWLLRDLTGDRFVQLIPFRLWELSNEWDSFVHCHAIDSTEDRYGKLQLFYETQEQFCKELIESLRRDIFDMSNYLADGENDRLLAAIEREIEQNGDGQPSMNFLHGFKIQFRPPDEQQAKGVNHGPNESQVSDR